MAANQNSRVVKEVEHWVDKAKTCLNDYTEKISENPNFIDFNMIESSKDGGNKDDILNQGDALLEKIEKEKDFPSLNGLDAQYSLVKF